MRRRHRSAASEYDTTDEFCLRFPAERDRKYNQWCDLALHFNVSFERREMAPRTGEERILHECVLNFNTEISRRYFRSEAVLKFTIFQNLRIA